MNNLFSKRVLDIPKSFIREILKVAVDPEIISFAGGLPNKELFPVKELQEAVNLQFQTSGKDILQYSTTEGYYPLREYIARRYKEKRNVKVSPENILITNGSQQALDLLGKVFLDEGDNLIIEEPGYLGAIQAFSIYTPVFRTVPLLEDGMDITYLEKVIDKYPSKLMYLVPNFQNPSGISYSELTRRKIAEIIKNKDIFMIEDDPYGELRYVGDEVASFMNTIPDKTILLGSFSKTVAPSFRLGWVIAPEIVMEKLIITKQASDLHSNYIGQRVLYQYLTSNDLDSHLSKIKDNYNNQRKAMLNNIEKYFPGEVLCTKPEGGMFLWVTLPKGMSAMKLFEIAINKKVAFVPGEPFYINKRNVNTFRLNYSCADEKTIEIGIKRLGKAIEEVLCS